MRRHPVGLFRRETSVLRVIPELTRIDTKRKTQKQCGAGYKFSIAAILKCLSVHWWRFVDELFRVNSRRKRHVLRRRHDCSRNWLMLAWARQDDRARLALAEPFTCPR